MWWLAKNGDSKIPKKKLRFSCCCWRWRVQELLTNETNDQDFYNECISFCFVDSDLHTMYSIQSFTASRIACIVLEGLERMVDKRCQPLSLWGFGVLRSSWYIVRPEPNFNRPGWTLESWYNWCYWPHSTEVKMSIPPSLSLKATANRQLQKPLLQFSKWLPTSEALEHQGDYGRTYYSSKGQTF